MKKSKKILCAVLSAAVFSTACAGCGGNENETADNGRITLKWMNNVAINPDSITEQYLEERYNVEIEPISVTSSYTEKLGAMLASSDVPDLFMVNEPEIWMPLAKQGMLAEIDYEMVQECAPGYYDAVLNFDENLFKICKINDKSYALPRFTGDEYNCSALWRKDWLDNVGITEVPDTLEEYEEALTRFRENDPDGNGKKDTYGMSGMGNHLQRFFDMIFGAYGIMPGQWSVDDNGTVTCDVISDLAKQALETLNRWYEKEIIHPEFLTDNVSTITEKFEKGSIGVRFATATNMTEYTAVGRAFFETLKQKNPEAEYVLGRLPSGPDGKRGDWLWGNRSNFVCFGKQMEQREEAMKVSLQILNDVMCNEEVALKAYYGDEGITYEMTEDGADFIGEYASSQDKRNEYGIGTFFNMLRPLVTWAVPEISDKYMSKKVVEYMNENAVFNESKDDLLRPVLDSSTIYSADLDKIRLVAYAAFITGERSLDEWDSFVAEYLEKGGQILLDEAQNYYDTVLK